jgi:hypothetical protein
MSEEVIVLDTNPETSNPKMMRSISGVILLFLILQFGTSFRLFCLPKMFSFLPASLKLACDPAIYPFLSYAMYSRAKPEGSQAKETTLFGILEDSREVEISSKDLDLGGHADLNAYKFKKYFVSYIRENDQDAIHKLAELYQKKNHQRLVGLRLKSYSYTISQDGIKKQEKSVQDISIN